MNRREFVYLCAAATSIELIQATNGEGVAIIFVIAGGVIVAGGVWAAWQLWRLAKRKLDPPPPVPQPAPGGGGHPPNRQPSNIFDAIVAGTTPPLRMEDAALLYDIYEPEGSNIMPNGEHARLYTKTVFQCATSLDFPDWRDEVTMELWISNTCCVVKWNDRVEQIDLGVATIAKPFAYLHHSMAATYDKLFWRAKAVIE